MVYIPAGPLVHYFNRWVERGRSADAVRGPDGGYWTMRYGARRRFQAVFPPAVFGFGCAAFIAAEIAGLPLGFWLRIGYACFIFPVFILMCWRAVRVCSSTVLLGESEITLRFGPLYRKAIDWSEICLVAYSQLWTAFIVEGADRRRITVPAEMDGVRTFCDFLSRLVDPAAIHPSVPKQMLKLL